MKYIHKIIAGFLAAVLILLIFPFPVKADEGTPKEEVIYINLNADGSVKDITVVSIFELDEDGKIIDYGKYESLRNMTTTDKIGYANETITIDAKAGRL
jgi:putative membrane protein